MVDGRLSSPPDQRPRLRKHANPFLGDEVRGGRAGMHDIHIRPVHSAMLLEYLPRIHEIHIFPPCPVLIHRRPFRIHLLFQAHTIVAPILQFPYQCVVGIEMSPGQPAVHRSDCDEQNRDPLFQKSIDLFLKILDMTLEK
jgi:hypothetical protein